MIYADLTIIQRDCLERRGDCKGCHHGSLISEPCKVRNSEPIAAEMGYPTLRRVGSNQRRRQPPEIPCHCVACGRDFLATTRRINCPDCREGVVGDKHAWRCKRCGNKYVAKCELAKCQNCRTARRTA